MVVSVMEFVLPAGHEGLHCRVAVRLVEELRRMDAEVSLGCGSRVADARSVVEMLALGCGPGCRLRVSARGATTSASTVRSSTVIC